MASEVRNLDLIINLKDQVSKELEVISGNLGRMQPAFKKMAAVGAAAFAGVVFSTKGFISAAAELEQQEVAFKTLLGSEELALTKLKELSDFAAKTPFEIQGIRQNAKQLLAMGIDQEKLLPTLKSLGDVSAGLSVPLERIALNYGQIATQGKLTGREVRDFAVAGVPLVEELAEMFGKTKSEIQDMVSAGEIGFSDVEKAFQNMSGEGGKFENLMNKQSKTVSGEWSNLRDTITQIQETIGTELIPIINDLFEVITPMLEATATWIKANPELTKNILLAVAGLSLLVLGIGTLGLILTPLITGIGFVATAMGGLSTLLLSPIGLIAVFATLAGVAIFKAIKAWGNLKEAQAEGKESMRQTGEALDEMQGKVDSLSTDKAKQQFQNAIDKAREFREEAERLNNLGFFGSLWEGAKNVMTGGGKSKKVNDAIISPNGNIITTHPDDYLIATKTPGKLIGGGGGSINININGGMYLDRNAGKKLAEILSETLRQKLRI